jgi:hypothetical protein
MLLGNPDRTVRDAVNFPTGQNPVQIEAGDFTGDGVPDLITRHTRDLSLLVNTGNGTFQAPVSVAAVGGAGDALTGLVVADFNGDGRARPGGVGVPERAAVRGRDVGVPRQRQRHVPGAGAARGPGGVVLAVARLDGDPHVDLVIGASVLRGLGNGSFQPGQALPPGFFLSVVRTISPC